jgi:hypothetical protein
MLFSSLKFLKVIFPSLKIENVQHFVPAFTPGRFIFSDVSDGIDNNRT